MSKLSLLGKKLLVVGGNSKIGAAVINKAASLGVKVTSITKSGSAKSMGTSDSDIEWISGESLEPKVFQSLLNEIDSVVQTSGIQLSPAIMKSSQKNTAKAIGTMLSQIGGKKMVYIEESRGLTSSTGTYVQTKQDIEQFLSGLPDLRLTVLRPGSIVDPEDKASGVYKFAKSFTGALAGLTGRVSMDTESTDINAVAGSAVLTAFLNEYDGKILESEEMQKIWEDFLSNKGGFHHSSV